MQHHRQPYYFGKILADLGSYSTHGYFNNLRDYDDTGIYVDEQRPYHTMFSITALRFRFVYNTVTSQYEFFEMDGHRQGPRITEGWDGLTTAQKETFVGNLYGFLFVNKLIVCTLPEYMMELCVAPARVS